MAKKITTLLGHLSPVHLLLTAGVLTLLCVCMAAGVVIYRPDLPGNGIVFAYEEDGLIGKHLGIYVTAPDGGNRRALFFSYPTPEQVVKIWKDVPTSLQGYLKPALAAELPYSPTWTAAGQQVAFRTRVNGQKCDQLFIMDIEVQEPTLVACLDRDLRDDTMDWAPDGSFLAYAARRGSVYLLNLINAQGFQGQQFILGDTVWGVAWSPDASRLAATVEGTASIWVYYLDKPVEIFETKAQAFGKPTWSPDGKQIAFLCYAEEQIDVCVINADGTGETQFHFPRPFPYLKENLQWSPDGQYIVFQAVVGGAFHDLFIIQPDGTDLRQLTFDPGDDSDPTWSPDGSQIAFVSRRDGNREIYTIHPDGTGLTRVTKTSGDEWSPVWRPAKP